MAELVTVEQANVLFHGLLLLGLLAAPLAALLARRRRGDPLAAALAAGGPLVLIGVLWRVYNTVTNRFGLDTVANLLVNLALFVVVGVLCGAFWAWFLARRRGAP
jgi:hypothetical protein